MAAAAQRAKDASAHAAIAGPAAESGAAGDGGTPSRRWPGWELVPPPLLTFVASLYGITAASYWRDEVATISATQRSLPQMLRMFGHVDAVHAAYYLLVWPLVHVFGTGEVVMRLPSAVAMAAAALGVTVIGRRLWSWQAGLIAGLVFAVLPLTSRFGQEARSYALATAVATAASYLLIRALGEPRRRWFAWYGLSVAALGFLNLFGLLIVPAHAITVAAAGRRAVRGWALSAVAGCLVTAPVAWYTWHERGQLAWLKKPHRHDIHVMIATLTGSARSWLPIVALSVVTVGVAWLQRGSGLDGRRVLAWLGASWLIVPPVVLLAGSQIKPMYVIRYVVICLPPIALLAGAGIAAVGRLVRVRPIEPLIAVAGIGVVALLGLPAQQTYRQAWGHGDDIRAADQFLAANERPGDAVVYFKPGTRDYAVAYPYGLAKLADIGLARSAVATGTLSGSQVAPTVLAQRLRGVTRVWMVEVASNRPYPALAGSPRFKLAQTTWHGDILLQLYEQAS